MKSIKRCLFIAYMTNMIFVVLFILDKGMLALVNECCTLIPVIGHIPAIFQDFFSIFFVAPILSWFIDPCLSLSQMNILDACENCAAGLAILCASIIGYKITKNVFLEILASFFIALVFIIGIYFIFLLIGFFAKYGKDTLEFVVSFGILGTLSLLVPSTATVIIIISQ